MIHSAGTEVLAVQEASKLMSESLTDSIIIGNMCIDENLNLFNKPYNKIQSNNGRRLNIFSHSF